MKNTIRLIDSLSRKNVVGTLILGQKRRSFEVFIEGDLLYLTRSHFIEKIDIQSLIEAGILGQKVTVTTLDTINIGTDLSQTILPEALHSRGLIDETEFRQLIVRHLQEELFARVQIYQDSFHFQDGYIPDCVVGGEGITVRHPLQLKPFLELVHERAERIVEIRNLVPSEEEVFVITEKGMAKKQESQWDEGYQKIFDLIDGFRSLRSIIDDGHLFRYYVEGRIFDALQEGWIKKTLMPELRGVDPDKLSSSAAKRYVPLYKNATKYGVDDLQAREGLAKILQKLGHHDEAVIQYNFLGDTLYQMGKKVSAIRAYNQGLTLRPEDPLISEKVTRIHLEEADACIEKKDNDGAISLLREALKFEPDNAVALQRLLDIYAAKGRWSEIADLCDQISATGRAKSDPAAAIEFLQGVVKKHPKQTLFHKKLINLFFDFKMTEEALGQMEHLAMLYMGLNKLDQGRDLVEKLLRMDPSRKHLRKYARTSGSGRRVRSRSAGQSRVLVKALLLALLAFAGYQWWTFQQLESVRGEQYLIHASTDWVQRSRNQKLFKSNLEVHLEDLVHRTVEFEREFPLSVFRFESRFLRDELTRIVSRLQDERDEIKKDILARGVKLINRGEIKRAHIELAPLLRCKNQDPWRSKAQQALSRAQSYEKAARELRRKIDTYRQNEEWTECFEAVSTLIQKYSLSQLARGVKFPVVLHTIPRGATVEFPGFRAETPCVIDLAPREKVEVQITSPEFESESLELHPSDGPQKTVSLYQRPSWQQTAVEFTPDAPVIGDGVVFAVSRDGDLHAFDLQSGKKIWAFEMPPVIQAVGAPLEVDGYLMLPLNDGRVVRFEPRTGRHTTFKVKGLLSTTPAPSDDNTTIVFTTTKGRLVEYSPRSNTIVAQMPVNPNNPPLRLSRAAGSSILGLDQSGGIFRADVRKGRIAWSTRMNSKIESGPLLAQSGETQAVVAVTTAGKLVGFDFSNGNTLWMNFDPDLEYLLLESTQKVLAVEDGRAIRRVNLSTGKPSVSLVSNIDFDSVEQVLDCSDVVGIIHRTGAIFLHDARTLDSRWAHAGSTARARSFCTLGSHVVLVDDEGRLATYRMPSDGKDALRPDSETSSSSSPGDEE